MNRIIKVITLIVVVIVTTGALPAKATSKSIEKKIIEEFQGEFEQIVVFAKSHPKPIKPSVLMEFIDNKMMGKWSAELTIRAILGKKLWAQQNTEEKQQLISAYTDTMRRYLYETFQKYNGQKPIAEKVQLNKKQNKGWLTVRLLINNFPDISVDLKLYNKENQWLIYDFRFQGVSFVTLKQHEYRTFVEKEGAKGLVKMMTDKNSAFFSAVSNSLNGKKPVKES